MIYKDTITNIKDLKTYRKEQLEKEMQTRESSRGTGVFLGENIQHYDFQCAKILLLQRLLEKLGVKVEEYDPFETEEDDNKFNYCGAVGSIGVKQ